MKKFVKKDKRTGLEKERDALLEHMRICLDTGDLDEYERLAKCLAIIDQGIEAEGKSKVRPIEVAGLGITGLGIAAPFVSNLITVKKVTAFEAEDVITTKLPSFLAKFPNPMNVFKK